ncbi:MAG: hypothetical protein H0U74_14305 [Bradymonadaceae bacterium]|nr:hypothetical protein [Lujinxingiaceae bacterium]
MYVHRALGASAILMLVLLTVMPPLAAEQPGEQPGEQLAQSEPAVDLEPGEVEAPDAPEPNEVAAAAYPDDPNERVAMARRAFNNSDFDILRPLLEPLLEPHAIIDDALERLDARQLLALGLFFEAQQVPDASRRRALLSSARGHFLDILREQPEFILDPLIYPASVVEIFESVRQDNETELRNIIAARNADALSTTRSDLQMLYIEREVQQHSLALNFFPFGIGQFQNNSSVKGTLFAVSQGLALALNIASYWMIERLRGPDGAYETTSSSRGGAYAEALGWRRTQYGALGAFAAFYTWSVLDGVLNFHPTQVHIRTLDEPPAELDGPGPRAGQGLNLGLGWSWRWRW